ncbi:MAG: hypothetical protein CVU59_13345, partial [Deltaproteobacteria bacterium HGW-Deltaproteobacteria-17]
MKPTETNPAHVDSILERMEDVQRKMADRRPAAGLPVWVKAALMGAGLTLAAGCAKEPAEREAAPQDSPAPQGTPAARDAPPQVMDAPPVAMDAPPPVRPEVPTTDATGTMTADATTPGEPRDPKLPGGIVGPDAGAMVPQWLGAYGAPPMQGTISIGPIGPMNGNSQGVVYGAPPMTGPEMATLRVTATPSVPADAPEELRRTAMIFHRILRSCLVTADRTSPLVPGGINLRMIFSEGRIKSLQVTGSLAQDATVKRCLAETNRKV